MARLLIMVFLLCVISANVLLARTFTEDTAIEYMKLMEKQLLALTSRLNKQQEEVANQNSKIAQQNVKFAELNTLKAQQNAKFSEQNAELNTAIAQQNLKFAEQNTQIAKQDTKFAIINTRFAELDCLQDKQRIERKDKQNGKEPCNCSQIADQTTKLSYQNTIISHLNSSLDKQTTRLAEYNATFAEQAAQIDEQNAIILQLNKSLAEEIAQIDEQNAIISRLNKSLAKEIAKHKNKPGNIEPVQSSTLNDYTVEKSVDGNTKTCSQTRYSWTSTSWWCVDLLQEYNISTINITSNSDYTSGFNVKMSSTGSCNENGFKSSKSCYTEPGVQHLNLFSVKRCTDGRQMSGRYVFISRRPRLDICEIELYSN